MRPFLIGAIVLQGYLIRWREADFAPRKRWRAKYALIWGAIAILVMSDTFKLSTMPMDRYNLALVGFYLLIFTPLALPVIISCLVQKSGVQQNRQSVD